MEADPEGRTPGGHHSTERQLLIASGGPQSMRTKNNTELQTGSDFSPH